MLLYVLVAVAAIIAIGLIFRLIARCLLRIILGLVLLAGVGLIIWLIASSVH